MMKSKKKSGKMEFISSFSSPAHFLKRNRRMKGARGGVHFTAVFVHEKMKKRRNEEGEDEKRRLVSFYILSVSLVKKEEKKEKNGGIRVSFSLFCSFLFERIEVGRSAKKSQFVLFSFNF